MDSHAPLSLTVSHCHTHSLTLINTHMHIACYDEIKAIHADSSILSHCDCPTLSLSDCLTCLTVVQGHLVYPIPFEADSDEGDICLYTEYNLQATDQAAVGGFKGSRVSTTTIDSVCHSAVLVRWHLVQCATACTSTCTHLIQCAIACTSTTDALTTI